MFSMNLVVFPILYTFCYEAESRKNLSVLFSPSLGSLRPAWGARYRILGCSMQHPPLSAEILHVPSWKLIYLSALKHSLSFQILCFLCTPLLTPSKALPNHLLRPAQFIIYTTPLHPMLLKGRLDLKNGDRKVGRCSHCCLAT